MKMNDNDAQFMAGMLQQAVFDLEDTKHELTRLQAEFVKEDDTYTAGTLDGMIKMLKRNVETQKDQLETYANFASVHANRELTTALINSAKADNDLAAEALELKNKADEIEDSEDEDYEKIDKLYAIADAKAKEKREQAEKMADENMKNRIALMEAMAKD